MKKIKNINNVIAWHADSKTALASRLKTNLSDGLSSKTASRRLREDGENSLPSKQRLSALILFFRQFHSLLIYILCGAAIISILLKDVVDAYIIGIAIVINVLVGFIQEYKAQKALEKLAQVVDRFAIVVRDGKTLRINAREVVCGDVVIFSAGSTVPADCRVIESDSLEVNEAILTGESLPVIKHARVISRINPELSNRKNMAFMGTVVTGGFGRGVVVATGLTTEVGHIAELIRVTDSEMTPLQKRLEVFGRKLGWFVLAACALLFFVGIIVGRSATEMFAVAVAVAVAAIPEGLAIAVTVILTLGMQRILREKTLIKRLVATETLGSTDVVCTDKTGTLTEGRMCVTDMILFDEIRSLEGDRPDLLSNDANFLLLGARLSVSAVINGTEGSSAGAIGSPTEVALFEASVRHGVKIEEYTPLDRDPFDSTKKFSANLYRLGNENVFIFLSGAPEIILSLSSFCINSGVEIPLTKKNIEKYNQALSTFTTQGMRLVGVAYRRFDKKVTRILDIRYDELVFLGFLVIRDTIRVGVPETIESARRAGIRTVMITGDHPDTALAIANRLGLGSDKRALLDGMTLSSLNEATLRKKVESVSVYARVTPHDKLRIVDALQANGHVVAMTGDGINDAPALKSADIGIALGSGTDVTKSVADMILLENNFISIIATIREGRVIMDNIKKVIVYLLADSMSALILVLGSLLMGFPLPITAAQVLWINLITDSFPYMALTFEKAEGDIMNVPPQKKNAPILDREMKVLIFGIGIIVDLFLLGIFYYYLSNGFSLEVARSVVFCALGVDTLLYAFSCKSLRRPLWKINIFDNRYLLIAVGLGFSILFVSLYNPFFRELLGLAHVGWREWAIIVPLALIKILGIESVKVWYARIRG